MVLKLLKIWMIKNTGSKTMSMINGLNLEKQSKVTDGVLGENVRNAARNISENALRLIERRRGLYKNYLSDRLCENKRNTKKVEKALKYELRRCEM